MFLIENPTTFQYEQITDKLIEVINASGICNYGENYGITGPELLHMADSLSEWLSSQTFEDAPIPENIEDTPEAILEYIAQEPALIHFDKEKRNSAVGRDREMRFKEITNHMKNAYETGCRTVTLLIQPGVGCDFSNSKETTELCEEEARHYINQEIYPRGFRVLKNEPPIDPRYKSEYYNTIVVGFD